jgi:sphingolipid delta-4 desaturase
MGVVQTDALSGETARLSDFIWSEEPEPHAKRKLEILAKHPEIKELFGPEPRTVPLVVATVALQVFMAWLTLDWCWPAYLAAVYVVGATANQSLFLAIHEISHNLAAKTLAANKVIAYVANLPIGIPYAMSFKPYHMEHHRFQGDDHHDTDIASRLECMLVTGRTFGYVDRVLRKLVWMFFQIFAYALRPTFTKPELFTKDRWAVMNYVVQFSFDAALVLYAGRLDVMLYLLLSTFFAGSIHPMAGHFLAEHYVVDGKTETYSYYGPLNCLAYNVGYHNEHHDFPNIPWSRLPKVREIAPEYNDHLPQCESWPGFILKFIFDDSISPYSRVKRDGKKAR